MLYSWDWDKTFSRCTSQFLIKVNIFDYYGPRLDHISRNLDTLNETGLPQGVKLFFFSGSHLAPKFFKVVAN